jgi:hypothetical protein
MNTFFSGRAERHRNRGIRERNVLRQGGAMFDKTTFQDLGLFVNAEMKGMISLENATFETRPPRFSGAKLHEGTV